MSGLRSDGGGRLPASNCGRRCANRMRRSPVLSLSPSGLTGRSSAPVLIYRARKKTAQNHVFTGSRIKCGMTAECVAVPRTCPGSA